MSHEQLSNNFRTRACTISASQLAKRSKPPNWQNSIERQTFINTTTKRFTPQKSNRCLSIHEAIVKLHKVHKALLACECLLQFWIWCERYQSDLTKDLFTENRRSNEALLVLAAVSTACIPTLHSKVIRNTATAKQRTSMRLL
jgi:hypothetical protein